MWYSCRASPSTTKEEEELEKGESCTRGGVRLPSLSLTIYRGKGEEAGALGFPYRRGCGHRETVDGFWRSHP